MLQKKAAAIIACNITRECMKHGDALQLSLDLGQELLIQLFKILELETDEMVTAKLCQSYAQVIRV
jgi:hypothetical protein